MKLAEALAKRADIQQRIQELEQRLYRSAQVQMGDNPPEDPEELLREIERSFGELQRLICAIDRTNAVAQLDGKTLIEVLAERAMLKNRRRVLVTLIERASVIIHRQTKSEIRFISTVKTAHLQKQAEQLAEAFRKLDLKLQAANWNIDLIEVPDTGAEAAENRENVK